MKIWVIEKKLNGERKWRFVRSEEDDYVAIRLCDIWGKGIKTYTYRVRAYVPERKKK